MHNKPCQVVNHLLGFNSASVSLFTLCPSRGFMSSHTEISPSKQLLLPLTGPGNHYCTFRLLQVEVFHVCLSILCLFDLSSTDTCYSTAVFSSPVHLLGDNWVVSTL